MRYVVTVVFSFCVTLFAAQGVDFSNVPGVVLDHQPVNYDWGYSAPRVFISDPEILVLSDGTYLAAHALAGRSSGSADSGQTTIFRSTDKGNSWAELTTINGTLRGSLVEYDGAVYLLGVLNDVGGGVVVCRSADRGETWSKSSVFSVGGLATPNNPVVFNGRLWSAAGRSSLSAPVGSDLLAEASWTKGYGFPAPQEDWLSGTSFIGEGQIVASPDLGLFILPKVKQYPYTALAGVDASTGVVSFDPDADFVSLPGGEKKFGAAYDAVSGKFYVLSNPILPAHAGSGIALDMIRNTAALLSSRDLRNWNVEKILLYSADEEKDGFGYMNLDFDGSNMVIAARTAFPVGSDDPQRGHDSNLLTFHQLSDFRNAAPNHVLKISGGEVLRYEKTDYQDAPLGTFALGSSFDGLALTSPNGLGRAPDGDVYIRESSGRILRFDASGNFLETASGAPVSFQTSELGVDQPANGECSWIGSSGGNWGDAANWYYWGRVDSVGEVAVFGSALTGAAGFAVEEPYTLSGFHFLTAEPCTFSGSGRFILEGTNALVDVDEGSHEMNIPVTLADDLSVAVANGSSVTMNSIDNLKGNSLTKTGDGVLAVKDAAFALNGGVLTVGGGSVSFTNSAYNFNGTVRFMTADGFVPTVGKSSRILSGDFHEGMFDELILPELEEGLGWDTSALYAEGTVTVVLKAPAAWMAEYGLPSDGSADFIDSDGDGMDNYSEWKAGTDPVNAQSFFSVSHDLSRDEQGGFRFQWNSVTGRTYRIERGTNLLDNPVFHTVEFGIPGKSGTMEFIDTNTVSHPASFYRVIVE